MIRRSLIFLLILLLAMIRVTPASAGRVEYSPKGVLSFTESTPWGDMTAVFTYCLANNLFTFSTVNLDGVRANSGQWSDNIGPFLADSKWIGANHLDSAGNPTAVSVSVEIAVDENYIDASADLTAECKILTIKVKNLIALTKTEPFAWEYVTYTVAGNSIEVEVEHEYICHRPVSVASYYGMQSMFVGEKEMLLPGSGLGNWFPVNGSANVSFTKKDAPDANLFIESNGVAMQATYLLREGLGEHTCISDKDNIFIHSDNDKSYHSLMRYHNVEPGETTRWHGIYSWFRSPVKDTFVSHDEEPYVVYGAYIAGAPYLVTAFDDGRITTAPYVRPVEKKYYSDYRVLNSGVMVSDAETGLSIFDTAGRLVGSGSGLHRLGSGIYIINNRRRQEKVRVR
ncbi:MAG: hypothetical protein K2H98_01310 [Duncaniella sp.]|nr:hypothetical protein [Duncaniella sp.]